MNCLFDLNYYSDLIDSVEEAAVDSVEIAVAVVVAVVRRDPVAFDCCRMDHCCSPSACLDPSLVEAIVVDYVVVCSVVDQHSPTASLTD